MRPFPLKDRLAVCKTFCKLLQTSSAGVARLGYAVGSPFGALLPLLQSAIGETHLFCLQGVADTVCRPAMVEVRGPGYSAQAFPTVPFQQRPELFEMTRLLQLKSFSVKGEKLTA